MAIKQTWTCDWLVQGAAHEAPAEIHFEGVIGKTTYAADLCGAHAPELARRLVELGVQVGTVLVDSKPRRHYVGDSGLPFTTSEARMWLIEEGHWHASHGRIPDDLLAIYASNH